MLLKLIPHNVNLPFLKWRKFALALSLILMLASAGLVVGKGLNLGIDFLGGSLIEVLAKPDTNIQDFRDRFSSLDLGEISLQTFGAENDILIRLQRQTGDETTQQQAIEIAQRAIDDLVIEYRRIEFVGPTIGSELRSAAIWATLSALAAIMIYVWFRFEWQFSVAAVATLFHDIILTIGLFALTGMEFNLAIVAALLTIAGYSINDTVVIFDRVRENLRKYRKMLLPDLLNKSVNQTLSRTIITSLTTELALLALVVFGGEVLRGFSIALMFGVFVGTYSSYFISVPLLNILEPDRSANE
ncbi:MAG: protein translocase subunit SecF [Alphaproteobacteria bacterium]